MYRFFSTSKRERIKVVSVKLSSKLLAAVVAARLGNSVTQRRMDAKGGKRWEEVRRSKMVIMGYLPIVCSTSTKTESSTICSHFFFSLLTLRSSGVRRALPSFSFGFHSLTLQAKVWRSDLKENLSQGRIPRQHSPPGREGGI